MENLQVRDVFVHAVSIRRLMKPKTDSELSHLYVHETCRSCHARFGVFKGRYLCRFCGRSYCNNCLSEKIDEVRACDNCYGAYTSPQSHVKSSKTTKKNSSSPQLSLDTTVLVNYHNQGMYRRAQVVAFSSGSSSEYTVRYEDGDVESNVPVARIRVDDDSAATLCVVPVIASASSTTTNTSATTLPTATIVNSNDFDTKQEDIVASTKQDDSSFSSQHKFQGYLSKRSRDGGSYRNRFFQLRYGTLFWYVVYALHFLTLREYILIR